jgi:hypothetical protein
MAEYYFDYKQIGSMICGSDRGRWMAFGRRLKNLENSGDIHVEYEDGKTKRFRLSLKGDALSHVLLESFGGKKNINDNSENYRLAQLSMLLVGYFGKGSANPKSELLRTIDYSTDGSVPPEIVKDFQGFREEITGKSNAECNVILKCLDASYEAKNFGETVRVVKSKMPRARNVKGTISYLVQRGFIGFDAD